MFRMLLLLISAVAKVVAASADLCASSSLVVNQHLYSNQDPKYICAPSGQYKFGFIGTSNVPALYNNEEKLWSAEITALSSDDTTLILQDDGNLVLRNTHTREALWSSDTHGSANAILALDDNDGQARLRTNSGIIWSTDGTTAKDKNCGHIPGTPPAKLLIPSDNIVDTSTLHGKVMAGYQGWFDTPCSDYENSRWRHWAHLGGPAPGPKAYQFEMWPDMRELDDDELCPTGFTYRDGRKAGLFSSYNEKTVARHFKWMSDYGVDGVFYQRFINQVTKELCFEDKVLNNVRRGAEKYGRVFANMYDVGKENANGDRELTVYEDIKNDWMYLVDVQEITKSPSYLHHNGRPVLSLWGFGIQNRPGEPAKVAELIDWFKNNPIERYRVTLKGGVANGWQTLGASSKKDEAWKKVYRMFDIISPWSVGRYSGEDGADKFAEKVTIPNAEECEQLGIDYMPVVWPGFSWSYKNLRYSDLDEPFNKYPREGGRFFWRQMYNSVNAFSDNAGKQVYVAMFDEVDEATSVMKVAETKYQVPTEGSWITFDEDGDLLPSDWYLRLIGKATKMLRLNGSVTYEMPDIKKELFQHKENEISLKVITEESAEKSATEMPTQSPTQGPTITMINLENFDHQNDIDEVYMEQKYRSSISDEDVIAAQKYASVSDSTRIGTGIPFLSYSLACATIFILCF